jgi:hypothetical protein
VISRVEEALNPVTENPLIIWLDVFWGYDDALGATTLCALKEVQVNNIIAQLQILYHML